MSGNKDSGREAVAWLATGAVCFLGILFSGLIILMFANEPTKPVLIVSGLFLGLAILLFLLREKPKDVVDAEEAKWFGIFRKPKATTHYKVTRHRKPKIVQFGTNAPPTAESIREIKEVSDGMKNWVPPATDPQHESSGDRGGVSPPVPPPQ
ncbi:MAG: hypothetical protein ACKV2Q_01670 [Planctomycetaceae bacterium]